MVLPEMRSRGEGEEMKPKGLKETIDRHQIIEHPCPKCGTEMAKIDDEDFTDENELRNFGTYWVCSSCGHEEKLKDGEG